MKAFDRYLRDRRISLAAGFLRATDSVLDVGCGDGTLLERWKRRYSTGIGVDPTLTADHEGDSYTLYAGSFPEAIPANLRFDVIVMLAVLEHLVPEAQAKARDACHRLLNPGGRVVITVPSPRVDDILHLLSRARIVDGMSMHEHYGFEPEDTLRIFPEPQFKLLLRRKFQLGLNHLFVFERT